MPYVIARDQHGKLIRKVELKSTPVTLGRSSTCDLSIPDANASREHCQLLPRDGKWFVRDLDSRNGTYIDGRRITSHSHIWSRWVPGGLNRHAFYK